MFLGELFQDDDLTPAPEGFGPTKKFYKFYGKYAGPGNAGDDPENPNPIDVVDAAAREHDICYFKNGKGNPECDRQFVKNLEDVLRGNLTQKQRMAARMMRSYFKAAGKKVANS